MVTGKGYVEYFSGRCAGDTIRAAPTRRLEYFDFAGGWIEPPVEAVLTGEPEDAGGIEGGGVEVGERVMGSGKTSTASVSSSTRTMAFRPLSVIHAAPSGPTMTPWGAEFSPRGINRMSPVAGSKRPSSPVNCEVYQMVPSAAGATS